MDTDQDSFVPLSKDELNKLVGQVGGECKAAQEEASYQLHDISGSAVLPLEQA